MIKIFADVMTWISLGYRYNVYPLDRRKKMLTLKAHDICDIFAISIIINADIDVTLLLLLSENMIHI